ncbi:hypothetical protein RHGRI_027059 [Rhododendron griersonianum]|uniref:Uncharacterized protein n=1 Tax=Rhododendron griersonianum TaxID=479676 RepID=A0AAV6IZF2_9ERIC|nr:hypothetical protein RHGRI_027059 [Rhododendron griersonianum]
MAKSSFIYVAFFVLLVVISSGGPAAEARSLAFVPLLCKANADCQKTSSAYDCVNGRCVCVKTKCTDIRSHSEATAIKEKKDMIRS